MHSVHCSVRSALSHLLHGNVHVAVQAGQDPSVVNARV